MLTTVIEPDCELVLPVWTDVSPADELWPWPELLPLLLPMTPFEPDEAEAAVAVVTFAPLLLLTDPLLWWPELPLTEEAFELTTVNEAASASEEPVRTEVSPPLLPLLLPMTMLEPDEAEADVEVTTVALLVLLTVAAKAGAAANIAAEAATAMSFFI